MIVASSPRNMTLFVFLWGSLILLMTVTTAALNPLVIKGYKFFDSLTGEEFVVKGIDYYPRPNAGKVLNRNSLDLFTNQYKHIWLRDIPYLQRLGVNTVRLYAVDPNESHDEFMCALEAAGIYAIVALAHDCATCAVTRDEAPVCYPIELKTQGQRVINAFAKYDNTMAFSAGNEVNNFAPSEEGPEWNAPCQKKFLRDMRAYMSKCYHASPMTPYGQYQMRQVPIGLVSADDHRDELTTYYNCYDDLDGDQHDGTDKYQTTEWYGLNSYVFCDGEVQTYDDALGMQLLQESFRSYNYSIPVLLTEFGCLSESFPTVDGYEGQRNFLQAKWLLEEEDLRDQFNGGFVFEYSIEMENAKGESPYPFKNFGHSNYGIGYFEPFNCNDVDVPCLYHPLPEYESLRRAYTLSVPLRAANVSAFVVPAHRQGKSKCPGHFPSIYQYTWDADSVDDIHCPKKGHDSRFTCVSKLSVISDVFNNLRRNPDKNGTATVPKSPISPEKQKEQKRDDLYMILVTCAGVVGIVLLLVAGFVPRRIKLVSLEADEDDDKPIPTYLTIVMPVSKSTSQPTSSSSSFYTMNTSCEESRSKESTGLLSSMERHHPYSDVTLSSKAMSHGGYLTMNSDRSSSPSTNDHSDQEGPRFDHSENDERAGGERRSN